MTPPTAAPRSASGLMQLHPNAEPFAWSRDGVAFLWLVALVLSLVLSIVLLGHGIDRPSG